MSEDREHPGAAAIFDAPNINHLWATLLVEELVRSGVTFFCLASGSRSTPLVVAVARHSAARHVMHFDERATAFMALGYGRATGRPAAWITTSGTAVANGLPAVVEASVDNVPLLLLTADRPPELRETGANQTIDQVKLFAGYTRWQFDLPAPTMDIAPEMVLTTADQAAYRARGAPAGPVHLNCMFREPLAPAPDGKDYAGYAAHLTDWTADGAPYTQYAEAAPLAHPSEMESLAKALCSVVCGLVVAGRLDTPEEAKAVACLAERLGWPLLPDVTSQLRLGTASGNEARIAYYDQVLTSRAFRAAHPAEAVLHIGGRVQSKRLRQYLAQCRPARYVVVRSDPARLDPGHQVTWRVEMDVLALCAALAERIERPAASATWRSAWQAASRHAAGVLDAFAEENEALSEPLVARLLAQRLPEGHGLCLASSMPVRDMDRYAALDGAAVPVIANRGASGIDGTVATAAGFAQGLARPITLVIGDLALLHDLNALALLHSAPVVVVVVNNNGGGIFSFLPIAQHEALFEPYFGTPHGLSFEHAAALFDLPYHRPATKDAFLEAYQKACAEGASALIEVQTDRAENRALHEELEERIAEAVSEMLSAKDRMRR